MGKKKRDWQDVKYVSAKKGKERGKNKSAPFLA
jgi:hypothetical protein